MFHILLWTQSAADIQKCHVLCQPSKIAAAFSSRHAKTCHAFFPFHIFSPYLNSQKQHSHDFFPQWKHFPWDLNKEHYCAYTLADCEPLGPKPGHSWGVVVTEGLYWVGIYSLGGGVGKISSKTNPTTLIFLWLFLEG